MDKFILTQDKNVAATFIDLGYKPLVNSGGFYIFENTLSLSNFCCNELKSGAYVFTNKLFI